MKKLILGMVLLSGLTFFACTQKSNDINNNVDLKTPIDDIIASETSLEGVVETTDYEADIYSLGIETIVAFDNSLKSGDQNKFQKMFQNMVKFHLRYKEGQFPNIVLDATAGSYPITITVDYGTGIELRDGRVLKGKIKLTLSGLPFAVGKTRVVTFENFVFNGVTITGTYTKTRTATTTQKTFTEIGNLTITLADGTIVTYNEEKVKTWVAGIETAFDPSDDVIEIKGVVQIKDSKENEFTKKITTPLVRTGTCKYITKGVVEFSYKGIVFATIDYGDGECDNIATKTTTEKGTVEIKLGKE